MSQFPLLNWAALTVSLTNAILLMWLGLTVLLNAERRGWGVWLAGLGLLVGGAFFISHSAILARGPLVLDLGMIFWWTVGLLPAIILPYAWYLVTLWYAGYARPGATRWRRHRVGFGLVTLLLAGGLAAALLGILFLTNLFAQQPLVAWLKIAFRWGVAGIPLLAMGYSVYVILCVSLALDALRDPEPHPWLMGVLARQRARPWLVGTSLGLVLVGLLVIAGLLFTVQATRTQPFFAFYQANAAFLASADLIVAGLITGIILLLGQAIVAYEIFTGQTLPRRGLLRQWQRTVVLAAGYGAVISGAFVWNIRPIYSLLLTAILMVGFYALFSWRAYTERDRLLAQLRPFVAGPRLYDRMVSPSSAATGSLSEALAPPRDVSDPFQTLCREILNADAACLIPLGPMGPLAGVSLTYPDGSPPASVDANGLSSWLNEAAGGAVTATCLPLPTGVVPPGSVLTWAVPLWSARGLSGALLLGPRQDRGLYTQEAIAIARAAGERLIDTRAGIEMTRRLVALQRQRLAQSQVVDRRARRVLHDDILPYLHTAMLTLGQAKGQGGSGPSQQAIELLTAAHQQIADLLREMPPAGAPAIDQLGLVAALRQAVDEELAAAFDTVTWHVESAAQEAAGDLPALAAEVLFYAAREGVRNAARHARDETTGRPLALEIGIDIHQNQFRIIIADNGVGLPAAGGGKGQGLALHSTLLAVIGGALSLESTPGAATQVTLAWPLNTAIAPEKRKKPGPGETSTVYRREL